MCTCVYIWRRAINMVAPPCDWSPNSFSDLMPILSIPILTLSDAMRSYEIRSRSSLISIRFVFDLIWSDSDVHWAPTERPLNVQSSPGRCPRALLRTNRQRCRTGSDWTEQASLQKLNLVTAVLSTIFLLFPGTLLMARRHIIHDI